MLRAPMSVERMTYDAGTGTVVYRSKMHLGLKRNFQVMPGAGWLALLCKHIPDRYARVDRYVGGYSNRARGGQAKGSIAARRCRAACAKRATKHRVRL